MAEHALPNSEAGRRTKRSAQSGRAASRAFSASIPCVIALLLIAIHVLTLHEGPAWASPLLIGDWLFNAGLAAATLAYALALGRHVTRPLLTAQDDPLTASLVALGLGTGCLSLGILGAGFLRLYYAPVFAVAAIALTVWMRADLSAIWRQVVSGVGWWFRAGVPSAPSRGQRLVVIVLAITFLSVLLRSALPVTEWDAVIYHLAGPKLYLAAHRIIPLPDLPLADAPSGAEMLFIPALFAGSDGMGKILNVFFALLLGLATYNLGRRHLERATAWLGVLLLFSMTWLQLVMPLTLTDCAATFLTVLSVTEACTWVQRRAAGTGDARRLGGAVHAAQRWPATLIESDDHLLIRAGLLAGFSVSFKLTSAPVIPTLMLTLALATLASGRVPGFRSQSHNLPQAIAIAGSRLWPAVRAGAIAGAVAMLPLAPWLLKNLYFFGHLFYGVAVQVSNPSQGVDIAATAPSLTQHLHWLASTFGSLVWDHMGALSALLLLAPIVLRRPEQRAMQIFFFIGSLLWLLFVPFFEPPRYYIGLVAVGQALTSGTVGGLLRRLSRPQLVEIALVAYLLVQSAQGLFAGLRFIDDPTLQQAALGLVSRQSYLTAHLPAYQAEAYANAHLPAGAEIALVNVDSGYYMDLAHINDWYGSTLAALQGNASSRRAIFAEWCRAGVRYAVFDRGSGSLDDNDRKDVRPRSAFAWLSTPDLRTLVMYSARGVDVVSIQPCAAASSTP